VLVLLLNDVGIDKLGSYAAQLADAGHEPTLRPATPVMDSLAAAGVRFSQAWASPTCSPTLASLHTGQHPFRHGVTAPVPPAPELESHDLTLPELVAETHATALIGKWHLGISGVDGDLDRLPVWDDLAAQGTAAEPVLLSHTLNPTLPRTKGGHALGVAALQDAQCYKLLVDVSVDPGDDSRVCARHALYDMRSDPLESRELSGVVECAEALAALQSAVADLALEGATWLAGEACSDP
jgi:hypothetical protein